MAEATKTSAMILTISASQLGVQEIPRGSNAGPDVEKYLKSIGLGKGYAWCAAFVYWCVSGATKAVGTKNTLPRTGWVQTMWNAKALRVATPMPGDIFVMNGCTHIGVVEAVTPTTIKTIEGNTNDEGSAEGYEVCRRERKRTAILGYLRIAS